MMKLENALQWLSSHEVCRGPFGLHRMEYLMDKLDNPHRDYACVTVGGTNGKGSVTALLDAIMTSTSDYLIGSTISPHLVNVCERIRLQGKSLPAEWWCKGVEALQEPVQIMSREPDLGAPSFFELVTALAFWAWRENDRDLAILEVGLGGRLDATNTAYGEIAVITNIGTDHREYLGPDREAIAREKLGIVKKKSVLITAEPDPTIRRIFTETCRSRKAELVLVKPSHGFELVQSHARGHTLKIADCPETLEFPLPGKHQLTNLATALTVIDRLRTHGFDIAPEAVVKGIQQVRWPGRLQWINGPIPMLLDGAHNQEGLDSLVSYLREFPMPRPARLILGALQQKPVVDMAKALLPFFDSLAFVPVQTGRSLTQDDFNEQVAPTDPRWRWHDSLESAVQVGIDSQSQSIMISGSLYLLAEYFRAHPEVFHP